MDTEHGLGQFLCSVMGADDKGRAQYLVLLVLRKVPPGGKCSDLFSSSIQLSEPVNKPRKIDR